jgi:hypothetical protein
MLVRGIAQTMIVSAGSFGLFLACGSAIHCEKKEDVKQLS